jgi:hypothetical protein
VADKTLKELEKQAGVEAGRQVRRETIDACNRLKLTPDFVLTRLKRLAKHKGRKPFHHQGDIIYSAPLDNPHVQLGAIKELALILDLYPSKDSDQERSGDRLNDLARIVMSGPDRGSEDDDGD